MPPECGAATCHDRPVTRTNARSTAETDRADSDRADSDRSESDRSASDQAELVGALASTSRLLMALTVRTLGAMDVDVSLSQFRTLVVLASRGPQRTVDLALELGVQSSTVTRNCDRLIRRKLVRRHQRPQDRRVSWLGLTEAGKELVGTTMRQRQAAIAQLAGGIDIPDPDRSPRY